MATIRFTDHGTAARMDARRRPLTLAVIAALRAPSIFNSQPWQWHIGGGIAHLHADRARQVPFVDPDGRLLTLSCGIALHHALTALAAEGIRTEVQRLPDRGNPDLLASIHCVGRTAVTSSARRLHRAMAVRRVDHRPLHPVPVPPAALDLLRHSVAATGVHLLIVKREQRGAFAETAAPVQHHAHAEYVVLCTNGDAATDWLLGGEALSTLLLTATSEGLTTSPMSDPVEAPASRAMLRRMLRHAGYPAIVVRVGVAEAGA